MKKASYLRKYAAIGAVLDHNGVRHLVYASEKLGGFVCLDRNTDEVLAVDVKKRRCEEKARVALVERNSKEAGEIIGKACVYKDDKNQWKVGTISNVELVKRFRGVAREVYIKERETPVSNYEVFHSGSSRAQATAHALNQLWKNYADLHDAAQSAFGAYQDCVEGIRSRKKRGKQ